MSSQASKLESSKASGDALEAEIGQIIDALDELERVDTLFPSMVGSPSI